MEDLIEGFSNPHPRPPEKPRGMSEGADNFLIGLGATLVVGTQLLSKSAPHVAAEVSKNTIGLDMALGVGKLTATKPALSLFMLPAPFGFVPPQLFGLTPNYLEPLNRRAGNPLPQSHLLRTQKDNNPTVLFERYEQHAREQWGEMGSRVARATDADILNALQVAKGPNAQRYFYRPAEIVNLLEVSLAVRHGKEGATKLIAGSTGDTIRGIMSEPTPTAPAGDTLLGTDVEKYLSKNQPVPRATGQASPPVSFGVMNINGGLSNLPPHNLQQEAAGRAPELLKNIASERADP